MKSLKRCMLSGLAALAAMTFLSASSALASETQLCTTDPGAGACSNPITHIHESTLAGARVVIKTNILTIECDALFLSSSIGALGGPQVIKGKFTYSNCNNSCTIIEENGPAELRALQTEPETAFATYKFLIRVGCGAFVECYYVGEGLVGTYKGALISTETNGQVKIIGQTIGYETFEEEVFVFCPESSKLTITTTPLSKTYIGS